MNARVALEIMLNDEDCIHIIDMMSAIHRDTKHYLLVAEELAEESVAFLQPMKEHRDAYDHLMRVFVSTAREGKKADGNVSQKGDTIPLNYIKDNVRKALGHEYRSFFDTVEWLTYIYRKSLREQLSYRGIRSRYEKLYGEEKLRDAQNLINSIPFTIAEYREHKDIRKEIGVLAQVEQFKETLEELLDLYREVQSV